MKIVWYCKDCNWVSISDSSITHCMENCKCGNCGVDLEEEYTRYIGEPIILAEFDNGVWTKK